MARTNPRFCKQLGAGGPMPEAEPIRDVYHKPGDAREILCKSLTLVEFEANIVTSQTTTKFTSLKLIAFNIVNKLLAFCILAYSTQLCSS